MSKISLGSVVRETRHALGLTQRELGARVGVESSHIAYIEQGSRKPSISLMLRIARELGLNSRDLFLYLHPDATTLLGRPQKPREPMRKDEAFRQFAANRALLARHRVTRKELKVLRQVSLLTRIPHPKHFLFILNSIRQAGEAD